MSQDRFSLFPASVVSSGPTTTNFTQMGEASVSPGSDFDDVMIAGTVDRAAVMLNFAKPSFRIQTMDLATLLALVSPTAGLNISGGSTFRFQKRADAGVFSTGSVHVTLTTTQGLLCLQSLSAQQGQPAVLELTNYPTFDGTNLPIVYTSGVDLAAAPAPAFVSQYYLGPAYLGGTQLEGLIGTRINFGINYDYTYADGVVFPMGGCIIARQPTIELTFNKLTNVTSVAGMFIASLATLKCYFAKAVASGAAREAYGSGTAHVKVTASTGVWAPDDISARRNEDSTLTVAARVTGTLSVSTASNIP